MIWIIFAVMTAAAIAALLWPVVRARPETRPVDRNAYDRTIFRDQLAELDRDLERGAIAAEEADAARNEISRRLIAATADNKVKPRPLGAPSMALLTVLIVPLVALPLYLRAGSPDLPDVPLAARIANAEKTGDYAALVAKVEDHLAKNPDDVKGWKVLAPAYRRAGRWSEEAEALRNVLRLSEPDAATMADYGEALVLANQGQVTAEAHEVFANALKLDAKHPKARFYDALALKQEGKTAEAKAAFDSFLADTPADAPWRQMLLAELQDMSARPPALDAQTMKDAASMAPADQQAMIRSMVDGLEAKLRADGSDLGGWLKLIRARSVLGDADKAKTAYDSAKLQFKDDPKALAQIDGLAKEMNIQ
jgi:cytochrome c-type biogenesis protein CcmH